jgi:hypothetical protein
MTWGVHPAITFDKALEVGQEVEARFTDNHQALRFPARIVALSERTARVESLEEGVNGQPAGHSFVIPRFPAPLWSQNNGLFPWHGQPQALDREMRTGDVPNRVSEAFPAREG